MGIPVIELDLSSGPDLKAAALFTGTVINEEDNAKS